MSFFAEIGEKWGSISAPLKIGFTLLVFVLLVSTALAFYWVLKDDSAVLFSNLEPQDAASIVKELEKVKVPYRLKDDGATILVDSNVVHRTRLKIMASDVSLRGAVGFEIFNNAEFGMTEFAQKINFQRALQGELTKTIMALDQVKFARVHLVLPEQGLFKKNSAKPKASITISTANEQSLSPEQIQGIQRLIAAAVPEISMADVTVVNHKGVALTRNVQSEGNLDSAYGHLDLKKQVESYFVKKIGGVLDSAFGVGQSIVSVDVALNHEQIKVTREDFIPHGKSNGESHGVVVRKRTVSQNDGTIDREGDGRNPTSSGREIRRIGGSSSTADTEYQNGKVMEQMVSMPGAIRRMSVGVLLPSNTDAGLVGKIRDMVSMSVGLMASRGDEIAVYSLAQVVSPSRDGAAITVHPQAIDVPMKTERSSGTQEVQQWILLILLSILFLAVVGWMVATRGRAQSSRCPSLSDEERSKLLSEVKEWLAAEEMSAAKKVS